MTYPSQRASVGIAKEAAYGTPVAPAMLVPASTIQAADVPTFAVDQAWRSAPAGSFAHRVATIASALTVTGPIYADTIGYPLAGILGDVTVTSAGGALYSTVCALLNTGTQQPPSYTVTVDDPVAQKQYSGCRYSGVTFTYDPGQMLTCSATLAGLPSLISAVTMPAPSSELSWLGWNGTASVTGTPETRLLTATLKLSRPLVAKRNITGQLGPNLQRADVLTVAGSMTVLAATDTYHAAMLNGTAQTLSLAFTSASRSLTAVMSNATLTAVATSYGARWVELAVNFSADADTTDAGASGGTSPIKVTLVNAAPSGTYA